MKSILCTIILGFLFSYAASIKGTEKQVKKKDSSILKDLNRKNPKLIQIRKEISANLRASKQNKEIPYSLRHLRYHMKEGDHFYKVMARSSQNEYTLLQANRIQSPEMLSSKKIIIIPNTRKIPQIIKKTRRKNRGKFIWPLEGNRKISSRFGLRKHPLRKKIHFHQGIDIPSISGVPVLATRKGKVLFQGAKKGYGKLVILEHSYGYTSHYGHLSSILVKKGESLKKGQVVGKTGRSGRVTGNHLHFEIQQNSKCQDPLLLLRHSQ